MKAHHSKKKSYLRWTVPSLSHWKYISSQFLIRQFTLFPARRNRSMRVLQCLAAWRPHVSWAFGPRIVSGQRCWNQHFQTIWDVLETLHNFSGQLNRSCPSNLLNHFQAHIKYHHRQGSVIIVSLHFPSAADCDGSTLKMPVSSKWALVLRALLQRASEEQFRKEEYHCEKKISWLHSEYVE